jgi:predicted Zn-ribbon and HTH transcriptional regulator
VDAAETIHEEATEEATEATDPETIEALQAIRDATDTDDPATVVKAVAEVLDRDGATAPGE